MSKLLLPKNKIQIKPDVFSKAEGDKLHILTFSSKFLVTLDKQGQEIWSIIQYSRGIIFSELVTTFKNEYEDFGEDETMWVSQFLSELHRLGIISIN